VVFFVRMMFRRCNVVSVEAAHSATARAGSAPLIRVGAVEIISAVAAKRRKVACVLKEEVVVRNG
jgi:hypothetical protein